MFCVDLSNITEHVDSSCYVGMPQYRPVSICLSMLHCPDRCSYQPDLFQSIFNNQPFVSTSRKQRITLHSIGLRISCAQEEANAKSRVQQHGNLGIQVLATRKHCLHFTVKNW